MDSVVSEKIKVGVVGVGYLGEHHARLYASLPGVELVGIHDTRPERAREIAAKYNTRVFDDWRDLAEAVRAVSVAVPTRSHHEIAGNLLARGIDVLVEKPIATTLSEADDLIREAAVRGAILQVGHSERFNAGVEAVGHLVENPRFIEIHRLGRFSERGTDVNVVLDLMIHDIDIVLSLARSPVVEIRALGVQVLSPHLDIANARIEFQSGCVADLTASRISMDKLRKIRIFQPNAYITLDYDRQQLGVFRRIMEESGPRVVLEEIPVEKREPLRAELEGFVVSVRERTPPRVRGEEGREALRIALAVHEAAERGLQRGTD